MNGDFLAGWDKRRSRLQNSKSGSGTHRAYCSLRAAVIPDGLKWQEREAAFRFHLTPTKRLRGSIPPFSHLLSWFCVYSYHKSQMDLLGIVSGLTK